TTDWLGKAHTNIIAWWIPKGAIIAALFAPVPARGAVWTVALLWMGTACILNAKRCGRTHCRYTGPLYLAMIAPIILIATGIVSISFYGWFALAFVIIPGGWIIWWQLNAHGENFHKHSSCPVLARSGHHDRAEPCPLMTL